MARRGWGGSTATALGVAAGTGAAQLGFGYGLGIINWAPAATGRAEAAWVASLAWATWISATSVIAGAVCAHRLRGTADNEPDGTVRRLGVALAAAVGALITVLLVAVPARAARLPDTSSPQAVAAGYALVGLLLGLLLATWALHTRAAAANLVATTGWLWLLAVVSVVDGVLSGRGLTTAQLGIWQISADSERFWIRDYFYWPGALLSLGSALVIGALAARRTAGVAERRVGAAASGAAGPLLVALAYLLAVPRLAAIAAEQVSAHLIAPYAVIAGVGGSALVAALAQRADRRAAGRTGAALPRQRTGAPDDLAPPALEAGPADPVDPTEPTPADGETAPVTTPGRAVDPEPARPAEEGTSTPAPGTARRGRAVPPQRSPVSAGTSGSKVGAATRTETGRSLVDASGMDETTSGSAEGGPPAVGARSRRRSR
ncbi:hypothetical protein ONA91_04815 [Micromonospora sp. DR5-3]|uniref:hypothetical protein n=1 Tax=unclassified Micromonospora TaxID=2617518 RepID=UPI0011D527FD|nr:MULTISPECIES: hypothetical protein [unclassified Micromonospora]MCW3813777.1 hypothetical protein [Micromonospora sp. DR5-3]TYC25540.1 hypothetical protein FXF52_03685 [Micromonospora sp. MP36]